MNRKIAIRLQVFHGFLTRFQSRDFIFNCRNFLYLILKDFNFSLEKNILLLLRSDHHLKPPIDSSSNHQTNEKRPKHGRLKQFFAALACGFPMR